MPNTNASLHGAQLKIERATKHLRDLERMWSGFLKTNPYEAVSDKDTGEQILKRAEPLPLCIPLLAGDVVHNLRSALDQMIWQLVIADGGTPEDDPRRYEFPIWESKSAFEAKFPGKAEGIGEKALYALKRMEPYKGGNDWFWPLHHLDIVDKHRTLVTVATGGARLGVADHLVAEYVDGKLDLSTFRPVAASRERPTLYIPRDMKRLKAGARFEDNKHFEVAPLIALDEPGLGERKALIQTLKEFIEKTRLALGIFAMCGEWGPHELGDPPNINVVPPSHDG